MLRANSTEADARKICSLGKEGKFLGEVTIVIDYGASGGDSSGQFRQCGFLLA